MLNDLPILKNTKQGWPWNEETDPTIYSELLICPKISIITPSYNHGSFIEEAIRSTLLQNYPNLEFIIIDGGSNDETLEIIEKYKDYISYFVSEKDEGQSDAMNKGLHVATGEIVGYINADDLYNKDAFYHAGIFFSEKKENTILMGKSEITDINLKRRSLRKPDIEFYQIIQQQRFTMPGGPISYFYHKKIHDIIGLYDVNNPNAMDYDFFLKAFRVSKIEFIDIIFGKFRYDVNSITFRAEHKDDTILFRMAFKEVKKIGMKYAILLTIAEVAARFLNKIPKERKRYYKRVDVKVYHKILSFFDCFIKESNYKY